MALTAKLPKAIQHRTTLNRIVNALLSFTLELQNIFATDSVDWFWLREWVSERVRIRKCLRASQGLNESVWLNRF